MDYDNSKDLKDIREKILDAQNPLIFFDDDPDGVISYILIRRMIDFKGSGTIVKSSPILKKIYLNKVIEKNPDLVIILDKPKVEDEFLNKVKVPIIWIDHHQPQNPESKNIIYFNPRNYDDGDNRPTSYLCYKINGNKKEMWLSMIGCVSDWYLPDFREKFIEQYPDLMENWHDTPPKALFDSGISILCKTFSFILKGKTSTVKSLIKKIEKIDSPYGLLNHETDATKKIYDHYIEHDKVYQSILTSVTTDKNSKLILYTYTDKRISFTSDISNELLHKYPDKVIIIGRKINGEMKMSLRSTKHNLPEIIKYAIDGLTGYGGGHTNACGAVVDSKDFEIFIKRIEERL